uniref:Secreted protein n=1 Tax=Mesocestoides corti TaxID=53468 RepID=A0A5K3FPV7_MESCO
MATAIAVTPTATNIATFNTISFFVFLYFVATREKNVPKCDGGALWQEDALQSQHDNRKRHLVDTREEGEEVEEGRSVLRSALDAPPEETCASQLHILASVHFTNVDANLQGISHAPLPLHFPRRSSDTRPPCVLLARQSNDF